MKNTIILTVHNKEKTIDRIVKSILTFTSDFTTDLIIILDGCTDNTISVINAFLDDFSTLIKIQFVETDDIWETKANNVGLRLAKTEFVTIIQDDMLILQKNWDKTLFKVFNRLNVFAVTGRSGHDFSILDSKLIASKLTGREYPLGSTNILGRIVGKVMAIFRPYWIYKYWSPTAVRLSVNRGPLMMRSSFLKQLDYLDEIFAPFELDDLDLCCRAFKKFNLKSASQPIYYKELGGSKATSLNSSKISISSIEKNTQYIIQRHSDLVFK